MLRTTEHDDNYYALSPRYKRYLLFLYIIACPISNPSDYMEPPSHIMH